jgi:hypothetical protein
VRQWRRRITQSALVDVPNSVRQQWDLLLECGHRVNRDYGGGGGPRSVDCEVCVDKARPWLRPDNGQPYGHIRTMSEPFGNNVWCGAVEAESFLWGASPSRPDWVCGACLVAWGINPADPS